MSKKINELLIELKLNNDELILMEIISCFQPIIKKYSNTLNYSDANSDLTFFLIKLIKNHILKLSIIEKEEKYIVGYIAKSIKFEYIRLSKLNRVAELFIPHSDFIEISCEDRYSNIDLSIDMDKALNKLSKEEYNIIFNIFIMERSQTWLAKELKISKQLLYFDNFLL